LRDERSESRALLTRFVVSTWKLAFEQSARGADLSREAFEAAQWADRQTTGTVLAQMAARFGAGAGELSRLVREEQDLVRQWQGLDKELIDALGAPPDRRNDRLIAHVRSAIEDTDKNLAEISARLR
jgi:hypothetical protein